MRVKVAYVTGDNCGSGHAVRGIALVQAAERYNLECSGASAEDTAVPTSRIVRLVDERPSRQPGAPPLHLRAFGPIVRPNGPLPDLTGYEGSWDWRQRVIQWQPDLLIGDLRADMLETLRAKLGVPSWLVVRIYPRWRGARGWDRVFSIEPGAAEYPRVTDRIPPIVGPWRFTPEEGAELHASYSTWWEAHRYGFADRVRWVTGGSPDCARRLEVGFGGVETNGADVLVNLALMRLTYPSPTAAPPPVPAETTPKL